jgi:lipoprotein-releasing system ATP-binding protein
MSNLLKKIIIADSITKKFVDGKLKVAVLHNINLAVEVGEMLAIVGPSGSGKSTLLHILGGLDYPSSGYVEINGIKLHKLSEKARSELRNKYLGFIYQFHHLLPEFSALENVMVPLLLGKDVKVAEARDRARNILAKVGLEKREQHFIGELSGGERQRVAIARALVNEPKCVFADEPTGNLDHKTALQIYEIISSLNADFKTAFVVVTHDLNIARKMFRTLTLENGCFV